MNKNPERTNNIDNIISELLNPKEPQHKKIHREVIEMVFGDRRVGKTFFTNKLREKLKE